MGHCGATVDGGATVIITGGSDNEDEATRSVEYFELFGANYDHSSDDALGYKRSMHACSNYMDPVSGLETVIIAGKNERSK